MAPLKLYVVRIEDWLPILFVMTGYHKRQVIAVLKAKFPDNYERFEFEISPPIKINQGTFFAIDPDLNVLEENKDIKIWFDEEFGMVIEEVDENIEDVIIDVETDESEEKSDDISEEVQWA